MPTKSQVSRHLAEMSKTLVFDSDLAALAAFRARVEETGRSGTTISYSDLAKGIKLQLPSVAGGEFELGVPEWIDLHRTIIGQYLFRLAVESYEAAGFFSSALVVSKADGVPSDGFRELLLQTGLIASKSGDAWLSVWVEHLNKAHAFYASR